MAIKNVYGFTEDGKKVKVGEYDNGLYPVGGRIFYIDNTSTAVVKFYDANSNELASVAVGDTPAYYKVITADTNGKDKYYVYREITENYIWTYFDVEAWAWKNETLGFTSEAIGDGKSNTDAIMTFRDGVYISDNSVQASAGPSIWYKIKEYRDNLIENCNDWYVGSKEEIEALRLFLDANASALGLTDFFKNTLIWGSSEKVNQIWTYMYEYSGWGSYGKVSASPRPSFIPIRSF